MVEDKATEMNSQVNIIHKHSLQPWLHHPNFPHIKHLFQSHKMIYSTLKVNHLHHLYFILNTMLLKVHKV